VKQVHRDFLLLRDYTGLCAVFIVFFSAVGFYAIQSNVIAWAYLALLVAHFLIVRQAAANYGARMVSTLARRAAAPDASTGTTKPTRRTPPAKPKQKPTE
jgi:hypothetical protein